ncbi:hypothetical protein ALC53_11698, partial [Atta colombica]
CESISTGFSAPTILIDYATTARQPLSHRRRVKGKPMPFDTDDVGHLYELIAAFDSIPHSEAMHRYTRWKKSVSRMPKLWHQHS